MPAFIKYENASKYSEEMYENDWKNSIINNTAYQNITANDLYKLLQLPLEAHECMLEQLRLPKPPGKYIYSL